MMLRDFEEKQAASNEKENEEKDLKVCYTEDFKQNISLLLDFSLIQIVQSSNQLQELHVQIVLAVDLGANF